MKSADVSNQHMAPLDEPQPHPSPETSPELAKLAESFYQPGPLQYFPQRSGSQLTVKFFDDEDQEVAALPMPPKLKIFDADGLEMAFLMESNDNTIEICAFDNPNSFAGPFWEVKRSPRPKPVRRRVCTADQSADKPDVKPELSESCE